MFLINNYPPIVALHYVSDNPMLSGLRPWVITHESFVRLLDFIETEGFTTLTFRDIQQQPIKKAIIITFDDCPKHLWDFAIPELQKRNMKAVFFMPTAYINGYDEWNAAVGGERILLMDDNDIKGLVDIGMEVGSHSNHHVMLSEHEDQFVISELTLSKKILESITNVPINSLAYPYGDVPKNYSSIAKKIGYTSALSVYTPFQNNFAIRRWIYDDNDTEETVRFKMSARYKLYRAINDKTSIWYKHFASSVYKRYAKLKRVITSVSGVAIFSPEDFQIILY